MPIAGQVGGRGKKRREERILTMRWGTSSLPGMNAVGVDCQNNGRLLTLWNC